MNTIPEIIEDIRIGKMVILCDDESRENEGDLVMAAECITPEAVNFMITHARGIVCMPMAEMLCKKLQFPVMVPGDHGPIVPKFTFSIEAAEGISTGVSAFDRAHTIKTATLPHATAKDFVMPGHVFPIQAESKGVLARPGHTEAACDLAQLAGFAPIGVICEVLNTDGSMARREGLDLFAKQHQLKIATIKDLIAYRLELAELTQQESI
jgi:3,4-dihydroxy 2-butanone 4-phosphate synthase/GTP cyclohydrolase II